MKKTRLLAVINSHPSHYCRLVLTSKVCGMAGVADGAALLVDSFEVADIRRAIWRLLPDRHHVRDLVDRDFDNSTHFAPDRIALQCAAVYRRIHAAQDYLP